MGMSILADKFRDKMKKSKNIKMEEGGQSIGYTTGFLNFDFLNGCVTYGKDPNGNKLKYYSVGITDGSMVMVIGRSACGKTTWAIQTGANIIRNYRTSCMFYDDIEGGSTDSRRKIITRFSDQELQDRVIYRNSGITAENFYERIKVIHDLKVENRAEYEYDTGMFDNYGNRIFKMEPTVMILDSLAMMMGEKYTDEDEISGQMAATATARMNASLFRRVVPMLKTANIILFVINHITEKVSLNMMPTKSDLSYLKQNETLPGGKNPVYLSNNMIRMDDMKLKEDKEFKISGAVITASLVKSRSARVGRSTKLVLNYDTGFDEELSLYLMLKDAGRINGAGAYLYVGDYDAVKFNQAGLKAKLKENAEFRDVFYEECMDVLKEMITDANEIQDDVSSTTTDAQSIVSRMNNLITA